MYLMGSLRNPKVVDLANALEDECSNVEVFDSWYAPGHEADDKWREYETMRGRKYEQALRGHAARHVFEFDKFHIDRCDAALLYMPAGKSAHLELGYVLGKGKPGFILFDEEPERWDVMYQFATGIFFDRNELIYTINTEYK
jgi:nucleoside 2-deoxyribosyltransferase